MIARAGLATLALLALTAAAPVTLRERQDQLSATEAEREATATAITLITRRLAANETRAAMLQARIAELDRLRAAQHAELAERQDEVLHLLAALQTLSRRPSPLLLAQPQSATDAARTSLLLDALVPQLRARTAGLHAAITQSAETRRRLVADRARLGAVQAALARDVARLEAAGQALASRAQSLRELVDALAQQAPAAPQLALARPASGRLIGRFGSQNALGVTTQGLSWRTAAGAPVVAPADGRVAFTGPYRTYGRIVIIEHASGVLSLLAGLETASTAAGQRVRAGAVIGRMGGNDPTLYFEVRSGGAPINPLPWLRKSSQG
jgi:septal ring factor EnvC (AmiA/AmiB activator)